MKMIPGTGTISDYSSFIYNCTLNHFKYRIPVNSLADVQLYIALSGAPGSISYELIHTCGPTGGDIEAITPIDYVVGTDTNGNYYGVFRNFAESTTATCFVIAITIDSQIYFSQEYCIENSVCEASPVLIQGCYGNLDPLLSYDCEGIYFGVSQGGTLGDSTVVYQHQLLLRGVEVTINAIKNSFKQGRTRNFRTEKEKIYQFYGERVPEWYISEIDAVFYRGEVYIDGTKYLVNETAFSKIDDCTRQWMPTATLKESCYNSFSCDADQCAAPPPESGSGSVPEGCCDPLGVSAEVAVIGDNDVQITNNSSGAAVITAVNWISGFVFGSPLASGTRYGNHDGFTGAIGVTMSGNPISGSLLLYINAALIQCINVGLAGSYSFGSQTFAADDLIQVVWDTGGCS